MSDLITVQNVSYHVKADNKSQVQILKNISFNIIENEILGICGESGAGKTTLAKLITGIISPSEGKISWNQKNILQKFGTSPVQLLFQNNGEILNPLRRINNVIEEAVSLVEKDKSLITRQVKYLFDSVGIISELRNRKGYELSGGEQQRAALARLLAVKPKLLILDEPFSAQDIESQWKLVGLFKNINKEFEVTVLCISHDINLLRKLTNRVIILKDGVIVESGNTGEVLLKPLQPYTKFLLKAENYSLTIDELHTKKV